MTGMEAAERVSPMAVLVRGYVERWLNGPVLRRLAQEVDSDNYERKITLEALLAVMLDAVIGMQPSVHAAAVARRDQWQGSLQALYTKLGRIDPLFSSDLVRETATQITPLIKKLGVKDDWDSRVKILDGTMPDASENRLGVLRGLRAVGLPAQCVVIYDRASGVCDRVVVDEDAYASEKTLAEPLLMEAEPGEIYVADRNFATSRIFAQLIGQQAFFVIREHRQALVYQAEGAAHFCGPGSSGDVLEGSVQLYDRFSDCTWTLRRIVVSLEQPTSEGETEVRLLTNLPQRHTAERIAELYRDRWTIERHFHLIKRELKGQMPSLGEPRTAIFALCLSLAAGNVLMMLKALERTRRPKSAKPDRVLSGYYVALEISRSFAAVEALTAARDWNRIARFSVAELIEWSCRLADRIPWSRFLTHPRGPKHPPPSKGRREPRRHYSTHRLKYEANANDAC